MARAPGARHAGPPRPLGRRGGPPGTTAPDPGTHTWVEAVLLACDGERWLPATLTALGEQTRPPDAVTTFDAASRDATATILAEHAAATGADARALTRRAGLLDAARAATARTPDAPADPTGWVWLLHDDSAPEPEALAQLLAAVEIAPSVGIAGCKVLDWDDPGLLRQAGFSTSALGRRMTGIEPGDRDQGQRDDRDDVLAVSTAGMLVRADLLAALGGDPAAGPLGDDLDLCRRARLAGARVVVVPSAVVHHADATREGRRDTPTARAVRWSERRAAVHARLVAATAPALPLVVLAVLVGGVLRALGRVAVKAPDRALGELTAVIAALASPRRVRAARRAAAATSVRPRRALRPLLVPRRDVARWHRDRWSRAAPAPAPVRATDPATGLRPGGRPRGGGAVLALVLVVLTAGAGIALHRLLGGGDVVGGALLPAPDQRSLWTAARSTWQAAGLGAPDPADPWLTLLALASLPLGASPALAVRVLLLMAVPASGAVAWAAAGAATRSPARRAAAALVWAGALPLLEAVGTGRLGALATHLALPLIALGLARTATAPTRRRALSAAAGAGLAAAVAVAGAPLLLPALLVVLLVVAATARRWTSCLLWTALAPTAALGPLLVPALADPTVLVTSPGAPVRAGLAPAWAQLLGVPATSSAATLGTATLGTAALVTGAALALVALLALVSARGGAGRGARAGVWTAAAGLASAVAAGALTGSSTAWTGPAAGLVLLGLGTAALLAGGRRVVSGLAATLLVLAPLAELGAWGSAQLRDHGGSASVHRRPAREAAVALDGARSGDAVRTLELSVAADGSVSAGLRRGPTTLADASAVRQAAQVASASGTAPTAAERAVLSAAATLAAGTADPRRQLGDLGVGFVLLDRTPGAPANMGATPLDAVPGLARAGRTADGTLYRVLPSARLGRPARVRVLAGGREVAVLASSGTGAAGRVPAAAAGSPRRVLVLAERADGGWRARLDGHRLRPVVHAGWAAAFVVPASGGHLVVSRADPTATAWSVLQVAVLGLTALLAMPVPGLARRRRGWSA